MRIVIDTNVLVSGIFFGGFPRKVINAVTSKRIEACCSNEILDEYYRTIKEFFERKQGTYDSNMLFPFVNSLDIIQVKTDVSLSRDPDDDKFIECAIDGNALYIVSGDKDLLILNKYEDIQIITAKTFCDIYL